jgi:hypothetical protein
MEYKFCVCARACASVRARVCVCVCECVCVRACVSRDTPAVQGGRSIVLSAQSRQLY